ncbi:PREDICTED: probable H/ACA ribonucleoprotein complex subunit 1 [Papilio xuthus]|nr:hypothetical protein RR46_08395 [Papilio xuthus]
MANVISYHKLPLTVTSPKSEVVQVGATAFTTSRVHTYIKEAQPKHNMRAFVVLACVALAYGRPEPPVGYSYSAPSRYSTPSGSYGAPSLGGIRGISAGGHSGALSGGISLGSAGLSLGGYSGGLSSSFSSGGISLGGGSIGGGLSLSGDSGFNGGYAGGYSGAPLVQKHIYVHVPPPEPVEQRIPRIPAVAPPQKHYKIIFIKAPTPPTPVAPIIPVQPQNEEKTLVYVLVKKPEEQPDIIIPTPAPTQPSKPEVYFIKYQTQKEGGAIGGGAIGGGAIGGGALGGGSLGGGSLGGGSIGGGDLSAISLGGSGIGGIGGGAGIGGGSGHGNDIGADFGTSGVEDSGSDGGHGGATSTQYGPPGHVAGPLH